MGSESNLLDRTLSVICFICTLQMLIPAPGENTSHFALQWSFLNLLMVKHKIGFSTEASGIKNSI